MADGEKRVLPKIRRSWLINPKTKIKPSGKIYSRKRKKKELKKIWDQI